MAQVEINTQGAGTFPLNSFPIRSFTSVSFPVVTFGGNQPPPEIPPPEVSFGSSDRKSYSLSKMKRLTNRLKL